MQAILLGDAAEAPWAARAILLGSAAGRIFYLLKMYSPSVHYGTQGIHSLVAECPTKALGEASFAESYYTEWAMPSVTLG